MSDIFDIFLPFLPEKWRYNYARPKNAPLTPDDLCHFMTHLIKVWRQLKKGTTITLNFLRHPKVAKDWLNFFASFGALVSMDGSIMYEFWTVEANMSPQVRKQLYHTLQSFAVDIIVVCERFASHHQYETKALVELNPALGDLFNCYGFGLINPKTGKVWITLPKKDYWNTDFRRSWLKQNFNEWTKEFNLGLREYAEEQKRKEEEERLQKPDLSEEELTQCAVWNEKCAYKPLLEDDWCGVRPKHFVGPLTDQQCFDLIELLSHLEAQLTTTKYENPYPQVPSDPFNRKPFPKEDLELFWDKARVLDVRQDFPKLARYIAAVQLNDVPPFTPDGSWEGNNLEKVVQILHAR